MLSFHNLRETRLRSNQPPTPPNVSHPVAWDPASREYVTASPTEKPVGVEARQTLIGHAIGDRIRYSTCSSFGCSTYEVRLTDVTFDGETVTVEWVRSRTGSGLIGDQRITVTVAGQQIGGEKSSFASGDHPGSASGPGAPGDEVVLTMESTFSDDSGRITATVPAPPFDPGGVEAVGCPTLDPPDVETGTPVQAGATVSNGNSQGTVFDLEFVFVDDAGAETVIGTRAGLLLGAEGEQTYTAELATSQVTVPTSGSITGDVVARVANATEA